MIEPVEKPNLVELQKNSGGGEAFFELFGFIGDNPTPKQQIRRNLTAAPEGSGNRARRRVAFMHRFQTIRSRAMSSVEGIANSYYFEGELDIPGSPPVTSAGDNRIFYPGDVVEVDTKGLPKGGWGKIIRLADTSRRRDGDVDTEWGCCPPCREIRDRFPLPKNLSNPAQFASVEIWKNNRGACLTVRFVPAYWTVTDGHARLQEPRIEFVKMEVLSAESEYDLKPSGYLHFSHEEPCAVQSIIFQRDDHSRAIDEYFVARLFAGRGRSVGKIELPGIGASIQARHFTAPPHEILGEKIYYA